MEKSEEDGKEFRPHWERDGKGRRAYFFTPQFAKKLYLAYALQYWSSIVYWFKSWPYFLALGSSGTNVVLVLVYLPYMTYI